MNFKIILRTSLEFEFMKLSFRPRFFAICSLLLFGLSSVRVSAQFNPIPTAQWIEEHKDSLRDVLLRNKTLPFDYEHSILAALMYYPNLEDTRINFKKRSLTTTMAALPTVGSIFRRSENRRYSILINQTKNKRKAPLLRDIPFEARVGVIGHELAHIVDYNRKSGVRLVGNGIAYSVSNSFKRNLENKIDRITINKGLGEGLYAFRLFVEQEANTTDRYRRFKNKIYLTSADIESLVESINQLAIED